MQVQHIKLAARWITDYVVDMEENGTIELLIWLFMPIILSVLIGISLRKTKWLSFVKFNVIGATLGIAGLVIGPTTLCSSFCDKYIGAGLFSLLVNSFFLLLAVLWLRGSKHEDSV
jgi:uncharacterized membrane protein YvlD (DUF360 family)